MSFIRKLSIRKISFIVIILLSFICNTFAIDSVTKIKYPFVLVNEDHGILTEAEISDETHGTTLEQFSENSHYNYWKCYQTKDVTITYRIMEYSKEWLEDVADLNINAVDDKGLVNQYGMRRGVGISFCKYSSDYWRKLMKNQKYVCIHGSYVGSNEELYNGKKQPVMGWVFNKLKTKKGCHNYFASRDCTGKAIKL